MNEESLREKYVELIISKIQKLLAQASNNPSRQEAVNAAKKAQELMARYNLTQIDVKIDKADLEEVNCHVGTSKSWKYQLANVVAANFCTKAFFIGSRTIVFYGRRHDIKISKDVFMFLFDTCEKLARMEWRKRRGEIGVYYWYTRGFIYGVENGLAEQCRALLVVTPPEVVEGYAERSKNFGRLSNAKATMGITSLNKDAWVAGNNDGKNAVAAKKLEDSRG